jgi:very-short-patch-repair endonuclease
LLWARINAGQLGVYFRRQAAIGSFIVDFLAPSVRLIVEVDGGYHVTRRSADKRRDRALSALGYRVLRLTEHSVRTDVHAAVEQIRQALTV